jgi:nitronate monooxygenase
MTSSQSFLGTTLPIIQAPMAGSQGHALAIAVSNAGGLGSLPSALLSAEALRKELETIRGQTRAPFNVNFFAHTPPTASAERESAWRATLAPYYQEYGIDPAAIPSGPGRTPFNTESLALLEECRPAVVSFHFGLPPADLLARVRATGTRVFSSATTLDEARWLEAQGVSAIIVQGLEAGGHRGHFLSPDLTRQSGTFALLPQVVRAVKVPVIAAGGIVDARTVKAALALGASAVQVGTTYLLCPEATISATYRAALKSPDAQYTALTNLFSGRPARGIVNRLMQDLSPLSDKPPEFPLASTALAPLRVKAEAQGRGDFSPLWAGQNVSGCKEIPAADLTRELMSVGS